MESCVRGAATLQFILIFLSPPSQMSKYPSTLRVQMKNRLYPIIKEFDDEQIRRLAEATMNSVAAAVAVANPSSQKINRFIKHAISPRLAVDDLSRAVGAAIAAVDLTIPQWPRFVLGDHFLGFFDDKAGDEDGARGAGGGVGGIRDGAMLSKRSPGFRKLLDKLAEGLGCYFKQHIISYGKPQMRFEGGTGPADKDAENAQVEFGQEKVEKTKLVDAEHVDSCDVQILLVNLIKSKEKHENLWHRGNDDLYRKINALIRLRTALVHYTSGGVDKHGKVFQDLESDECANSVGPYCDAAVYVLRRVQRSKFGKGVSADLNRVIIELAKIKEQMLDRETCIAKSSPGGGCRDAPDAITYLNGVLRHHEDVRMQNRFARFIVRSITSRIDILEPFTKSERFARPPHAWLDFLIRSTTAVPLFVVRDTIETSLRAAGELVPGEATIGDLQEAVRPVIETVHGSICGLPPWSTVPTARDLVITRGKPTMVSAPVGGVGGGVDGGGGGGGNGNGGTHPFLNGNTVKVVLRSEGRPPAVRDDMKDGLHLKTFKVAAAAASTFTLQTVEVDDDGKHADVDSSGFAGDAASVTTKSIELVRSDHAADHEGEFDDNDLQTHCEETLKTYAEGLLLPTGEAGTIKQPSEMPLIHSVGDAGQHSLVVDCVFSPPFGGGVKVYYHIQAKGGDGPPLRIGTVGLKKVPPESAYLGFRLNRPTASVVAYSGWSERESSVGFHAQCTLKLNDGQNEVQVANHFVREEPPLLEQVAFDRGTKLPLVLECAGEFFATALTLPPNTNTGDKLTLQRKEHTVERLRRMLPQGGLSYALTLPIVPTAGAGKSPQPGLPGAPPHIQVQEGLKRAQKVVEKWEMKKQKAKTGLLSEGNEATLHNARAFSCSAETFLAAAEAQGILPQVDQRDVAAAVATIDLNAVVIEEEKPEEKGDDDNDSTEAIEGGSRDESGASVNTERDPSDPGAPVKEETDGGNMKKELKRLEKHERQGAVLEQKKMNKEDLNEAQMKKLGKLEGWRMAIISVKAAIKDILDECGGEEEKTEVAAKGGP